MGEVTVLFICLFLMFAGMAYGLTKTRSRRLTPKVRRSKGIARKSKFKIYEHPFKQFRLQPSENIRRKAEQCRAEQRASNNLAEMRFAEILRQLGVKFEYQHIIYRTGSFVVVDFMVGRVIYEIDGKCHKETVGYDAGRDAWLRSQGYHVHRISAADVFRKRMEVLERVKGDLWV